ncbi:extracellular solute-binding protein [Microvirga tunisiensis]|uniref:Extracellular solute-binding protein n=1 Tax=Pannonibacter tanglangensis TaxID=2750084 RepID=A0A7X5F0Q3_9HYPH|nr:ABC transporter substrate-binding protein [Pannonibacter sp. XCT-53]NBN77630.1 extracellular solute-binding protein [Pannonibacter sp. XCT-53]
MRNIAAAAGDADRLRMTAAPLAAAPRAAAPLAAVLALVAPAPAAAAAAGGMAGGAAGVAAGGCGLQALARLLPRLRPFLPPFLLPCLLLVGLLLAAGPARALEIEAEREFGAAGAPLRITVLSTTDIAVFAPVLEGFIAARPDVAVRYVVASSKEIFAALDQGSAPVDVVISSAMDLQMKLANDGRAQPLPAAVLGGRPSWARWRDTLVAVAQEPAVILVSRAALAGGLPVPRTRRDLIALLRDHPERFRGRIGTYDPQVSGAGYLFATQDARLGETFWRLAEVMGRLDTRLYCCSAEMIDALVAGDLLVGYNVLGSYSRNDAAFRDKVILVEPEDFTVTLLRTALIPQEARNPAAAGAFLTYLLSPTGQDLVREAAGLPLIDHAAYAEKPHLRPIRLDPGLLAHLDRRMRAQFLVEWQAAMDQP